MIIFELSALNIIDEKDIFSDIISSALQEWNLSDKNRLLMDGIQ